MPTSYILEHIGGHMFVLLKLTVAESQRDLRICPLTFLVFVVKPLYSETPDTPSNAATALISAKKEKKNKTFK